MTGYEGQVVLNYRLTRKLGSGGFGAVYLAEQLELGRRAACKILHPQFAREPAVVDRFFREARAVCEIGHRAIVTIENFGRLPAGEPFYLMELVPGRSLRQIIADRWLTSEQLIAIFDPIADALRAAHAKQIVHRDLKPDNIMVQLEHDRVDDVRLLDFGIAKLMDRDGANSITGTVMGTPAYMAPEQAIDAKHVDERADVYAFGATLYTAIARRPPFTAAAAAAILLEAQTQPAPALATLRPGVPAELEAAVARCLAKSREHRPATIAEAWAPIRTALAHRALLVPGAGNTEITLPPVVAVTLPPDALTIAATLPPDVPTPPETPVAITPPPDVPTPETPVADDPLPARVDDAPVVKRAKRATNKSVKRGAAKREKRPKRTAKPRGAKRVGAKAVVKRMGDAGATKRVGDAVKRVRSPAKRVGDAKRSEVKRDVAVAPEAATSTKLRWIVLAIVGAIAIGVLALTR